MARNAAADRMGIGLPFEGTSGRIINGTGALARLARRYARWHYFATIERHVPEGARVLEFGSGGGDAWLATRYRTVGLELAFDSAAASRRSYGDAINADVRFIPLRDRSVDAVTSSFVLEHLDDETAARSFADIHRVLKKGGVFVSLCDLESDHPFLKFVRDRWPEGYHEAYREVPGHTGLRSAAAWRAIIDKAGFDIVRWNLVSRFPVLDHCPWCQLSASDRFPKRVRGIGQAAFAISRIPFFGRMWATTVTVADAMTRPLFPERWAYRLLFVTRRTS
jgi:SAM-dependent methyltransferase